MFKVLSPPNRPHQASLEFMVQTKVVQYFRKTGFYRDPGRKYLHQYEFYRELPLNQG